MITNHGTCQNCLQIPSGVINVVSRPNNLSENTYLKIVMHCRCAVKKYVCQLSYTRLAESESRCLASHWSAGRGSGCSQWLSCAGGGTQRWCCPHGKPRGRKLLVSPVVSLNTQWNPFFSYTRSRRRISYSSFCWSRFFVKQWILPALHASIKP